MKHIYITLILLSYIGSPMAHAVDTSKAVIHHTAGSKLSDRDLTVKEIDQMHKARGWDGCGYHYVIRKNGDIEVGRSIGKKGAHAKGRNQYVGIALTGYDKFTPEQLGSLVKLLKDLNTKQISRHHEQCPGTGLDVEGIQEGL